MFETNTNKSLQELLELVRNGAVQEVNNRTTGYSITPFATLLVKLGQDHAELANRTLEAQARLTASLDAFRIESARSGKALNWLTLAIVALTLGLVVAGGIDVYEKHFAPKPSAPAPSYVE